MKHFFLPAIVLFLSLPALALAEGFVPLTSIPAFQDLGTSPNMSGFLNNVYRICIGIAAALAVLQLIRAGITYMGGDSITDKRKARELILMSLLGLLLVLSPVIVFSIINPDILSLRIDTSSLTPSDAGAIQQTPSTPGGAGAGAGAGGTNPGTFPQVNGQTIVLGTYISWGIFSATGLTDAPDYKSATQYANEWLNSSSCSGKPTKKVQTPCLSDGAGSCTGQNAYCKGSVIINEFREKKEGDWLWGGWNNLTGQDTSAETKFRDECRVATNEVDRTPDVSIDTSRTNYACDRVIISQNYQGYLSNSQYECRRATLSCQLR